MSIHEYASKLFINLGKYMCSMASANGVLLFLCSSNCYEYSDKFVNDTFLLRSVKDRGILRRASHVFFFLKLSIK